MGSGGVRVPPEERQSWAYRMGWAPPAVVVGGTLATLSPQAQP